MDVSVKKTSSLGRRLKFVVPLAAVETGVAKRIKRLGKTARLDGFRAGKIPAKVLQERYGKSVFQEVAFGVIETSYQQALTDHKLTPVGDADFSETKVLPGEDIHFVVDIEVYPEFELASLSEEKLEKPSVEVTDDDIMKAIDLVRLRKAKWSSVQRRPKSGDRVRVYLEEKVETLNTDENDELLVSMDASGVEGDFAAQLLKCESGDNKKIKLKFPKDHPDTEWAGKKLKFRVEVRAVEESLLADLDEDFFRQCGIEEGGLDKLKELFKEGMEYELDKKLRQDMKEKMSELLIRKHDIELPATLVRREIDRMRAGMVERLKLDEKKAAELEDKTFTKHAERNVKLGMIMNKVAETQGLEVSDQEFEANLGYLAGHHEDAEATKQHYRSDPQARSHLRGMILEEKVFQWVREQAQMEEKKSTFDEVVNP